MEQPRRTVLRGMGLLPLGLGCATSRPGGGPSGAEGSGGGGGGFRVIGYVPSRARSDEIRYGELTHLNYAFAFPQPDGRLRPLPNPDRLAALVRGARAHGVKVCISVGGWHGGDDSAFESLAASPAARDLFVEEVMALVDRHGLDGVDMDWEYPDAGASARHNVLLMNQLRGRLGPHRLLTAAVVGHGKQGAGVLTDVFALTDFINIMAYDNDDHGQRPHSPYDYAVTCIDYWSGRGLPREQLVLGVPFYGKLPETTYRQLVNRDPRAADRDELDGVHYNGVETMKRKTSLALARGSGIMIWEITQDTADDSSLLRAIHRTIRPPAPPPVAVAR
jgi:chitinase